MPPHRPVNFTRIGASVAPRYFRPVLRGVVRGATPRRRHLRTDRALGGRARRDRPRVRSGARVSPARRVPPDEPDVPVRFRRSSSFPREGAPGVRTPARQPGPRARAVSHAFGRRENRARRGPVSRVFAARPRPRRGRRRILVLLRVQRVHGPRRVASVSRARQSSERSRADLHRAHAGAGQRASAPTTARTRPGRERPFASRAWSPTRTMAAFRRTSTTPTPARC